MRVALATCTTLPDWEVDDHPFHAAVAALGIEVVHPAWDDPGVDWSDFDACLIRTTWDYQHRREEYIAWADRVARTTTLLNPAPIVRWNTCKRYLGDLEDRGVPTIPTIWIDRGEAPDLPSLMAREGWLRGFLKPIVGATARETLRFDADDAGFGEAATHLDRLLGEEPMMLQPYLAGVETAGECSAIFIDGAFSHGVRKVPRPGDYRVQDDWGAADEPHTFPDEERAMAGRILDEVSAMDELWPGGGATRSLLYARVDFLRDDEGILRLSELELVEPSLFFRHDPNAAPRLAGALAARLRDG